MSTPKWQTFGLGLLFPGGGFLYNGMFGLAFASLCAMLFTYLPIYLFTYLPIYLFTYLPIYLFLWNLLATEKLLFPVWFGTALIIALMAGDNLWHPALWVTPTILFSCLSLGTLVHQIKFRTKRKAGQALNEELANTKFPISITPKHAVIESTPEDLSALRYPLNLLLQPIESYGGFSKIDQFREGALRYQLNWSQFALATYQFTRTPNFTGYLSEHHWK